jgi:hypothetical protein
MFVRVGRTDLGSRFSGVAAAAARAKKREKKHETGDEFALAGL